MVRLPSRTAFLPLVMGELLHVGAVTVHDEDLAAPLRGAGVKGLVFESGSRTGKQKARSVGRPGQVCFIAMGVCQLVQVRPVRMNCHYFEVAGYVAHKRDQISAR